MRIEYYVSLKGEQVIQVGRLRGVEKFEGGRDDFIFNTFICYGKI